MGCSLYFPDIEGPGDQDMQIKIKMPNYRKVTMQEDVILWDFDLYKLYKKDNWLAII